MKENCLIVSVHDVAPVFQKEIEAILKRLSLLGVSKCSLLIVPDYHHSGRIDANPAWADRLQDWMAQGHEMVLHGYHHQADDQKGRKSFKNHFFRNFYTSQESEFLELNFDEAQKRLQMGLEVLSNIGLKTRGFVAPAWLMNEEVLKALKKLGFEYTNTLKKIVDLKSGQVSDCWAQVFSSRALWRRGLSVVWNEALFRRNRKEYCLRISIHPPEYRYPMLWKHLESLIQRALTTRKTITYIDFVDR